MRKKEDNWPKIVANKLLRNYCEDIFIFSCKYIRS